MLLKTEMNGCSNEATEGFLSNDTRRLCFPQQCQTDVIRIENAVYLDMRPINHRVFNLRDILIWRTFDFCKLNCGWLQLKTSNKFPPMLLLKSFTKTDKNVSYWTSKYVAHMNFFLLWIVFYTHAHSRLQAHDTCHLEMCWCSCACLRFNSPAV